MNQVHDWSFTQKFGIMNLPEGDDASDESNESGSEESSSNVKSYLKLIDKKIKLAQMLEMFLHFANNAGSLKYSE